MYVGDNVRRHASRAEEVGCSSEEQGCDEELDEPEGYEDFFQPYRHISAAVGSGEN